MEKEIKINVPDGFEIDEINSTFELIKFKPVVNEINKSEAMSDFLFQMFNNTVAKITGEKQITYYDNEHWLFQQDYKNDRLWVRYLLIWRVLEKKYGLNYIQIRDFIGVWVETNLGWKGLIVIESGHVNSI